MFRNMLRTPDNMVSMEYEQPSPPVTSSQFETLPLAPLPHSPTYEFPKDAVDTATPPQTGGGVSTTAYDVPIDARGNIRDRRLATPVQLTLAESGRESGVYDTLVDAVWRGGDDVMTTPTQGCDHPRQGRGEESETCETLTYLDSASLCESDAMLRDEAISMDSSKVCMRPLPQYTWRVEGERWMAVERRGCALFMTMKNTFEWHQH